MLVVIRRVWFGLGRRVCVCGGTVDFFYVVVDVDDLVAQTYCATTRACVVSGQFAATQMYEYGVEFAFDLIADFFFDHGAQHGIQIPMRKISTKYEYISFLNG